MTLEKLMESQLNLMREINAKELTYECVNETYKLTLILTRK